MQLHSLRFREAQKHFKFFWEKGNCNYAAYFTKHNPLSHHKSIRSTYVQDKPTDGHDKIDYLSHVPSIHTNHALPTPYIQLN